MEEEMRSLIENYNSNQERFDRLQAKLIRLLDYNTKITASYGHNEYGGKGSVSSKVESHVIKICSLEKRIMEVGNKIYIVNQAEKVLNDREKEVIELVKIYRNKLTKIARILNKDKAYVFNMRNRSIKKMCSYMEGEYARRMERH